MCSIYASARLLLTTRNRLNMVLSPHIIFTTFTRFWKLLVHLTCSINTTLCIVYSWCRSGCCREDKLVQQVVTVKLGVRRVNKFVTTFFFLFQQKYRFSWLYKSIHPALLTSLSWIFVSQVSLCTPVWDSPCVWHNFLFSILGTSTLTKISLFFQASIWA